MDLYYSPLSCSLAARIVCIEAGIAVTYRRADLQTKRVHGDADGALYAKNLLGKVPTLVFDDGFVLTENVAVLLCLADLAPEASRIMPRAQRERYQVVSWLSFIATELHKRVLSVAFSVEAPSDGARQFARDGAERPLRTLEAHLAGRSFLVSESFTVADALLVWALILLPRPRSGVSLEPYPRVRAYLEGHMARASVSAAVRTEFQEYKEPGWWTAPQ
jgi:glutathione S-transferase